MSASTAAPAPSAPKRPPSRLSARAVTLAVGLALLLTVLLSLAGLAVYERVQVLDRVAERNELLARVFADQANRNVEAASLAAATLAELVQRGMQPAGAEMRAALQQTLVNLPFLRGMAIVDAQGTVLGSADPEDLGQHVELPALGPMPLPGRDVLGRYVPARRLRDVPAGTARAATPAGAGFLPLLRRTQPAGAGAPMLVVALLNPQAWSNFQLVTMNDARAAAALVGYDGQLIATAGGVQRDIGASLQALPPFRDFLPRLEHGSWVGAGLRPGVQVATFRVAATRPLLVIVELAHADAMAEWRRRAQGLALAAVAAAVLIGLMTSIAARSVRSRERARRERDDAQAQVAAREHELSVTRLRTQLAITEQLMENSPLPTSVTDTARRYVMVNQAWEAFTGRRRAEAIGQLAGRHLTPQQRTASEENDRWLLATGQPARYEDKYPHADGTLRDVVVNKLPLTGEDGKPWGILSAVMDVTEFRNAERATREARDAAEDASQAKSEFIANISHELRTPLQSIIGFSELGSLRGREHPKLAGMFDDIHAAGQRMLALVNDLLDVAKIESTVGTIHLERTDLRGLVREVLRELDPLLAPRRLRVALQLPDHALRGRVDPLRFQQVLRNVMANAIKFSPDGGLIEVLGEVTEDDELHLAVADHGPGIPGAELEAIFEAFVQSSSTKDGSGGTGLGLAICRKIVVAHGGRIHAENRPGGGATFHIHLPSRAAGETLPAPL